MAEGAAGGGPEERVSFGAAVRDVTPQLARERGLPAAFGVEVGTVRPNSAAQIGGVEPGDIITAIGPYTIQGGAEQFSRAVAARRPGDIMALTVWRTGRRERLSIRFGDAPPGDDAPAPPAGGP